ncbi:hypothetical protein HNS40_22530, partial [Lentimicrobium sp. S6]|nr:hypothetical protein [Lentimicrobium sp. S6]NPD48344.1 hypothetical protein [Lentimicrobium sp. S6]
EEVYQKKLANGIKEEALNISQWSAGIYVIIVRSENHMVGSAKLVVE